MGAARRACGRAAGAPDDLPGKGSSGRRFAGPVPGARAGRAPPGGTAGAAGAMTGARTSGPAANDIAARAAGAEARGGGHAREGGAVPRGRP